MTTCKRVMCCMVFFACCASYAWAQTANPYVLTVGTKPYLLRSYLMFEGKKRTHVISVGTPEKVNYAYDLKTGALLQVWRGGFLDVTEMWKDRGEPQLAKPLGTALVLTGAPFLAVLKDKDAAWPDSIAFDDLQNKGYVLGKDKMPAFEYTVYGTAVTDKIAVAAGSLQRTVGFKDAQGSMYCRLAAGPAIEKQDNNLYVIAGKAYSIKLTGNAKPIVRKTNDGQELLVPVAKGVSSLTYSLIW